jgi:hypothetical protein
MMNGWMDANAKRGNQKTEEEYTRNGPTNETRKGAR